MRCISDHILDIVQNSVRAKATLIEIVLESSVENDLFSIVIKDNGIGMDSDTVLKATDPFYTSRKTRKVGLGLSLLQQNAIQGGGGFRITSEPGNGTRVEATFRLSNPDMLPLGDVWDSFYLNVVSWPEISFFYCHKTDAGEFLVTSFEIHELLQDMPFNTRKIRSAVTEYIKNNIKELEKTKYQYD
jgi:hypothetical protein